MTQLAPPQRAILPGTGEMVDLTDDEQVAAASNYAGRMIALCKTLKETTDEILRERLKEQAATSLMLGDVEVTEKTGALVWDVEALYHGLEEAGLKGPALEALFKVERSVASATELNKLANRVDEYAKVIEAARSRRRGGIVTKRRKPEAAVAPATPAHIQEHVASGRQAEAEAEQLGI